MATRLDLFSGSCKELRECVRTYGVTDEDGVNHPNNWGWTTWKVLANGQAKADFDSRLATRKEKKSTKGQLTCIQATEVDVEFAAEMQTTIMEWKPTMPSDLCERRLDKVKTKILTHEGKHQKDIRKIIDMANKRWHKLPAFEVCDKIEGSARARLEKTITQAIKDEIDAIQKEIKAAGAVLDQKESVDINCAGCPDSALKGLDIDPLNVPGGATSRGTIRLSDKAPATGVTIKLSSDNNAAVVPPLVNVKAGQDSTSFSITTTPVRDVTDPVITAAYKDIKLNKQMRVNPPYLMNLVTPKRLGSGQSGEGTVILNGKTAGPFVVILDSNKLLTVPGLVVVEAGQSSATFTVSASNVKSEVSGSVTARGGGHTMSSRTIIHPK